jgi:dTDP-4-amino-4,6-dideoxygalactose transaminase
MGDREFIYLSPPHVGPLERELLLAAFDSNWIAPAGPDLPAFEQELADFVGVPHAVALSSGTAALHLALVALGVQPGDDVLVSDLTFAATANAVAYVGARPVFVDSDRTSWNMDPQLLEEELGERARRGRLPAAAIVVDLYGQCADWDRIVDVCRRYEVPTIEDAAEALGSTYHGRAAGSFADLGVFSFNGNKIITTSGGGMLVSHSGTHIDRARHLATQARQPVAHYEHEDVGFNYRLSNLLAAIGRGQLRNLPERVAARRGINERYRAALGDIEGLEFMPADANGVPNHWLTVVTIDPEVTGATPHDLVAALHAEGIEARPAWKPMHLQPVFAGAEVRGGAVGEAVFATGLCLPSGSALTEAQQDRVTSALHSLLDARRAAPVSISPAIGMAASVGRA